ncbi:hypothetical protein ABKN59_003434 [Abortiporus biennis]
MCGGAYHSTIHRRQQQSPSQHKHPRNEHPQHKPQQSQSQPQQSQVTPRPAQGEVQQSHSNPSQSSQSTARQPPNQNQPQERQSYYNNNSQQTPSDNDPKWWIDENGLFICPRCFEAFERPKHIQKHALKSCQEGDEYRPPIGIGLAIEDSEDVKPVKSLLEGRSKRQKIRCVDRTRRALIRQLARKEGSIIAEINDYLKCGVEEIRHAIGNLSNDNLDEDEDYLLGKKGDIILISDSEEDEQPPSGESPEEISSGKGPIVKTEMVQTCVERPAGDAIQASPTETTSILAASATVSIRIMKNPYPHCHCQGRKIPSVQDLYNPTPYATPSRMFQVPRRISKTWQRLQHLWSSGRGLITSLAMGKIQRGGRRNATQVG